MIGIKLALEDYPFDEIWTFCKNRLYPHIKNAKEERSYKEVFTLLMEVYEQYIFGKVKQRDLIFVLGELYKMLGRELLET